METIIKYKYNEINSEFTTYLSDETLGDLQEILLNKLNISLINIKYIICNYTINNEECTECIGQIPYTTKLIDFLMLKDDPIFNLISNDIYTLNNYHYSFLDYIRYRNFNDYEEQQRNIQNNTNNTNNNYVYYFYTTPSTLSNNTFTDNTINTINNTTLSSLFENISNNSYDNLTNIINDYSDDVKIVLTDEEINNLNYGKYIDLKNNDDEYNCPITLKKLEDNDDVVKLPCSHIFCKNELLEWVSNDSNKCPMCRATIANGRALI